VSKEIKSKILTIRLSEDLHYKLKLKATEERKSIQKVVENLIRDYVKETDKESKKN